jgi:hypothetical protein
VRSRLMVTVDGCSHEFPCSLNVGGDPVNIRTALKC